MTVGQGDGGWKKIEKKKLKHREKGKRGEVKHWNKFDFLSHDFFLLKTSSREHFDVVCGIVPSEMIKNKSHQPLGPFDMIMVFHLILSAQMMT